MYDAAGSQPPRGAFIGQVTANRAICDEHYLLRLAIAGFPPSRPGQFVQLLCRGLDEQVSVREVDWPEGRLPRFTQAELTDHEPLLRRPLSLAGRRDGEDDRAVLDFIYRTIGTGTTWLAGVEPGRSLSVLGPLGNAFRIRPDKPLAALVAGGVGIPPMIYLAEALSAAGKKAFAFCGVRSRTLLPLTLNSDAEPATTGRPTLCVTEFAAHGVPTAVATDDGSVGFGGMVSEAFGKWLNAHVEDADELTVYCCGPEPMMQAVGETCVSRGIECQLAMERHMACGMGACQSCVVKVRHDDRPGWSFRLCCTDGPVFDARRIVW